MPRPKKKTTPTIDIADLQPDELRLLKAKVQEFINRLEGVENEITALKEDRKAIIEDYSKHLDMPTLKAALQVAKIRSKVERKDAFDTFMEVLANPET